MNTRESILRVLARYEGRTKTAAFPPFSKSGPPEPLGGSQTRNIPKDHDYDPQALKPLAKSLWAASVALGHALAAYRHFSRLKSATISPDGQLGGRGYILGITDVRKKLYDACEALSAVSDTLYDEIEAPHWRPKLAQLDDNEAEDVQRFVEQSREYMESPEDEAEEKIQDIEKENDKPGSELPNAGNLDSDAETGVQAPVEPKSMEKLASRDWKANSSIPVDTLPGPRVDHLGPAEGEGPFGSFNDEEDFPQDRWILDEGGAGRRDEGGEDYDYTSEWENDLRESSSSLPEDSETGTEAWDFGLGYGARGQGAGGYLNPSGEGSGDKGVAGPHSGLPGLPYISPGDTTPSIDVNLNDRSALLESLPGDVVEPVARSDYYPGPKDNLIQDASSGLPGETPAALPQDLSLIDVGEKYEDGETPYVRYDYTTHYYRDDPLHDWPQKQEYLNG